jgi:taurine--2-oxoglutarate transaminase
MADGVVIQAWVSHFVIAPPLIVTKEELDRGIDMLDKHLAIADALVDEATPLVELATSSR